VKLSNKELRLISDIQKSRKARKIGGWITLLLIPISYIWYPQVSGVITAIVVTHLIHEYLAIHPDDELVDLLQRYVNSDPEAIVQLSKSSRADV
jgi:hypothetical protein